MLLFGVLTAVLPTPSLAQERPGQNPQAVGPGATSRPAAAPAPASAPGAGAASAPTTLAAGASSATTGRLGIPETWPRLGIVGFTSKPGTDPRDDWMPTFLEELLTRRLQRVPGLLVVPTVRLHQARKEIAEPNQPPPPWPLIIRGLGVNHWMRAEVSGTDPATTVEVVLERIDVEPRIERRATFNGRLLEDLDQATRWVLGQFGLEGLPQPLEQLIFAPPSRFPSALEYYARAMAAVEADNARDALRYATQALEADRLFRPALTLIAQLDAQSGPSGWSSAVRRLQALADLSRRDDDAFDRVRAEIGLSLVLQAEGAFEAAYTRANTALELADDAHDIYGALGAMTALTDGYLLRRVPQQDVPEAARLTFARESLKKAAEWERLIVEKLDELGDRLAELPETNKLALMYEKLELTDEALELHQLTLKLADQLQSRRHQATAWLYLGEWYRKQARYAEALDAMQRCLRLADEDSRPEVRIALGGVYRAMEKHEDALAQYEAAWEQVRKGDELARHFLCLRELAQARLQVGRRDKAIATLQEALDIAHALEMKNEEARLREQLDEWKKGGEGARTQGAK